MERPAEVVNEWLHSPNAPAARAVTAKETRFAVRFVHPQERDGAWMAVVEGPGNSMLDVDLGADPDEALAAVIESIASYDFDGGDEEGAPPG